MVAGPFVAAGRDEVCYVGFETAQDRANARLIAAAPELLEALKGACDIIADLSRYANNNGGMIDDETFSMGMEAIAKARGHD